MKKLVFLVAVFLVFISQTVSAGEFAVNKKWEYEKGIIQQVLVRGASVDTQGPLKSVGSEMVLAIRRTDGSAKAVSVIVAKVWFTHADGKVETNSGIEFKNIAECRQGVKSPCEIIWTSTDIYLGKTEQNFISPYELEMLNQKIFTEIIPQILSGKYKNAVAW